VIQRALVLKDGPVITADAIMIDQSSITDIQSQTATAQAVN
jgi:two-component system, response regulator FlrC